MAHHYICRITGPNLLSRRLGPVCTMILSSDYERLNFRISSTRYASAGSDSDDFQLVLQAHAKERRAEALVRERKFEEAAKCHEQAAHLFSKIHIPVQQPDLDDIHSSTGDKSTRNYDPSTRKSQLHSALESIQLQRDYHHKQATFVRMKQVQYEEYKATMEIQEKELLSKQSGVNKHCGKGTTGHFVTVDRGEKFLHQAIDKAMEEQDSLLELILPPKNGNVVPKRPKDPAVVLEELRTVNGQLRSLIGTLLNQLEDSQHQVKVLTEQLRVASTSDKEPLTLTNEDSSISLSPLPPLAPLEMPPFDFSTH